MGKERDVKRSRSSNGEGGQDAEPYLDVDHNERRWDQ